MRETNAPIVSKVVKRYFYRGKGYATKRAAYRAKAKALIIEMVLGPWIENEDEYSNHSWWELENRNPIHGFMPEENNLTVKGKAWVDFRFSLFFPHHGENGCEAVKWTSWARTPCQTVYDSDWDVMSEGPRPQEDYRFLSCKFAQSQWLDAKVKELMDADQPTQEGAL